MSNWSKIFSVVNCLWLTVSHQSYYIIVIFVTYIQMLVVWCFNKSLFIWPVLVFSMVEESRLNGVIKSIKSPMCLINLSVRRLLLFYHGQR